MSSTGNQTITLNSLSDGTYSDCTITVTDSAGNASNTITLTSFTIDTSGPVLSITSAIHTPSPDTTPSFNFSSDEGGTFSISGSCSSSTTSASSGSNTVTLTALSVGTYTDCSFTVTDSLGNASSSTSLGSFSIIDSSNLLAFYPFTGNANDESGNSMNGTVSGATLTTDRNSNSNQAYSFDGSNDLIDLPDGFNDFSNGVTIAAWVKWDSTSGNYQRILDLSNGAPDNNIIFGNHSTTSDLYYNVYPHNNPFTASSAISTGTWKHYAATHATDGTTKLYVNGTEQSSGSNSLPANVVRTINRIGKSPWSADAYLDGAVDEVYIFNRTLSASEISVLAGN